MHKVPQVLHEWSKGRKHSFSPPQSFFCALDLICYGNSLHKNHIFSLVFLYLCPTVKWWRGLWSIPSWMLLWRWLMMAARMVDRFITWAHWARPRVNSSFQQARTRLVLASWLETEDKHKNKERKIKVWACKYIWMHPTPVHNVTGVDLCFQILPPESVF